MPSFLVETFVPEGSVARFEDDVDGLRAAAERHPLADRPVRYVRSYLLPNDEMGFHVLEAPDATAVERLAATAHVDVERVVAAIGLESDDADQAPRREIP
jgi:hypothetical protein